MALHTITLMQEPIVALEDMYLEKFGSGPPSIGWPDSELRAALVLALATGEPMLGAHEVFSYPEGAVI